MSYIDEIDFSKVDVDVDEDGKMFITDADNMKKSLDRDLLNTSSKFWTAFLEYRKGGKAAFPDNWN